MLCGVRTEVVFRGEGKHVNTEVVKGKPEEGVGPASSVWHGQPVQIGSEVKLGLEKSQGRGQGLGQGQSQGQCLIVEHNSFCLMETDGGEEGLHLMHYWYIVRGIVAAEKMIS